MKKSGILNAELAWVVSLMGHGDRLMVVDAGFPIPEGVQRIDLAITGGKPPLTEVVGAILEELYVESYVIAHEFNATLNVSNLGPGTDVLNKLLDLFKTEYEAENQPPRPREKAAKQQTCSHAELKQMAGECVAVVRTGECTPYANVCLISGVTF